MTHDFGRECLNRSHAPKADIRLAAARRFVEDMRGYFAEELGVKRDEIAARRLHVLRAFRGLREKKLRLVDV